MTLDSRVPHKRQQESRYTTRQHIHLQNISIQSCLTWHHTPQSTYIFYFQENPFFSKNLKITLTLASHYPSTAPTPVTPATVLIGSRSCYRSVPQRARDQPHPHPTPRFRGAQSRTDRGRPVTRREMLVARAERNGSLA